MSETDGRSPQSAQDSDARLVARAKRGDEKAFSELAVRYETPLRRFLYRVMRDCDAAYDAVQEALIKAWRNITRFESRSRFSTWLTRIGINEASNSMRRRHPEPLDPHDATALRLADPGSGPADIAEARDALRALVDALEQLPPEFRTAVTLRDVKGLTTAEAAQVLGIGQAALKTRLHRGRAALNESLKEVV